MGKWVSAQGLLSPQEGRTGLKGKKEKRLRRGGKKDVGWENMKEGAKGEWGERGNINKKGDRYRMLFPEIPMEACFFAVSRASCTRQFSSPVCRRGKNEIVSLASAVFQLTLTQIMPNSIYWGGICDHCLVTLGEPGSAYTSRILYLATAALHETHNCHPCRLLTETHGRNEGRRIFLYCFALC